MLHFSEEGDYHSRIYHAQNKQLGHWLMRNLSVTIFFDLFRNKPAAESYPEDFFYLADIASLHRHRRGQNYKIVEMIS